MAREEKSSTGSQNTAPYSKQYREGGGNILTECPCASDIKQRIKILRLWNKTENSVKTQKKYCQSKSMETILRCQN